MASNHTENYGLCQWEATDQVLRTDFNEDNAKIDGGLEQLRGAMERKAEQTVVDALSQTVAQKADQRALETEINARAEAVAVLSEKAGMQLIRRMTLAEGSEKIKLDLSDVDWNRWAMVHILIIPVIDDTYDVGSSAGGLGLPYRASGSLLMAFYPMFHQNQRIWGTYWPSYQGSQEISTTMTFQSLQYMDFSATNYIFLPGTVIEVWGQK